MTARPRGLEHIIFCSEHSGRFGAPQGEHRTQNIHYIPRFVCVWAERQGGGERRGGGSGGPDLLLEVEEGVAGAQDGGVPAGQRLRVLHEALALLTKRRVPARHYLLHRLALHL